MFATLLSGTGSATTTVCRKIDFT